MKIKYILTPVLAGLTCLLVSKPAGASAIIAHRGASYDAPENTVAAMKLAWEQGADAIECDIHLTGDGKIIVIHDQTTDRVTGVTGKVSKMKMDVLRTLDAGSWKDPKFAGEKLPTLEEVLATVPEGKRILIEMKAPRKIVPPLKAILEASDLKPEQVVLIAFDYNTISDAKRLMPDYEALWLVRYQPDKTTGKLPMELSELIAKSKKAGLDGLDLSHDWPMDSAFVKQVRDAGLKLYSWTVDDFETAKLHRDLGLDGITTNRPGWIKNQLNSKKE